MEVMIALAILVGSAAVLSQLIDKGRRHAMRATDVTEAQTIGNNVMSEILAGLRPLESSSAQPVDPYLPWDFSIQIEPTEIDELAAVTVAVFKRPLPGSRPVERDAAERRAYRLVRWVRQEVSDVTP